MLGGGGWHWKRLEAAFACRGMRAARLAFESCGLAADGPGGVRLGALQALPRLVVVRAMPPGSFEQVTLRLGVLHALAALGVRIANEAAAIERCVDKSATGFHLARAGVPSPPAWTVETEEAARLLAEEAQATGHALVLKPLFGNQGKGLRLVRSAADLPPAEAVAGVYHLQRFIGGEAGWHDWRVLVAEGEPVAAMVRHGKGWITNIRQGARPEPHEAGGELGETAVAAAAAVGAAYAGVDLMRDREGRLQVLEVNSMPAWQGLQSVTGFDIAGRLADRLLAGLGRPAAAA
ncbi:ATP-grasp domain-containing protein [Geminicoccaceae bacterium 1502E]|nr:ATP-grasp domain-containing protein [Geminicoccaceae bacterium 1502E]